ncbi:MAG: hypothetical protein ACI4FZ_04300 [Lachnospiraceae bacterium]
MKKESFITLLLGVVGGLLFALGMCMCLLPEWGAFSLGIGFGIAGVIVLLITWVVYRRLSGKAPLRLNAKTVGKILYGILSALVLGVGMCMTLVFEGTMIIGILVGIVGIVMLLCLIPMCLGFKESEK